MGTNLRASPGVRGWWIAPGLSLLALIPAGTAIPARTWSPPPPRFQRIVIDARVENSSHKPKVFDRFSKDGDNDVGSLDKDGFKLYRYAQQWRPYIIFP